MAQQGGINKLQEQREIKRDKLIELGVDPYGGRYDNTQSAVSIQQSYVEDTEGQSAIAAGRIVLLRDIGKLIFIAGTAKNSNAEH